jgi:UDP-N-acetylmuramate: L-alanyl-gamma-D-glutamyl-meso-diaminopimelate ligase
MSRHAHFIGLCGAGMSAAARLLQDAGWTVTGSDDGFYPPISTVIERYRIPCAVGYRAQNIPKDADTIVIGRHARLVPETNPEVAAALASGRRVVSFPEAIQGLLPGRIPVVVAGSFGKSSCTALMTWALVHAGRDPGWFLGAEALDLADNGHLGGGEAFVLEGDEYPAANFDPTSKFLFYRPRHVLLTSAEHDHINVFPTLDDYLKPYAALLATLPTDGVLAAAREGAHLAPLVERARARTVWYAAEECGADWWATEPVRADGRTQMTLVGPGEEIPLETGLLGRHNRENIVGVGALLRTAGLVTGDEYAEAVRTFRGVRRRLERLTPDDRLPVYNDFGSSPAKCRAGIETIREHFPGRRLTVVFEPHTFSFRNRGALGWYDRLFAGAHRVLVLPPPGHGAQTHDQLGQEEIVARIAGAGITATSVTDADALLAELAATVTADWDIVLIESSGAVAGAIPRIADWAATLI